MSGSGHDPLIVELSENYEWCSLQNHPLSGCTLYQWLYIWWTNRDDIDYQQYWSRVVFLTIVSSFNSLFAIIDYIVFELFTTRTETTSRPLFILGQPRSGTTLVYNLLADDSRFAAPSTLQVGFPSCFLSIEKFVDWPPLNKVLSPTRPMDNIPLNWHGKQ
jgi:Sulfotransferase family